MLEAGRSGPSEDRSNWDAIVVLGARVYQDGRPSLVLTDRVRTGSQSLLAAPKQAQLLLSGGSGGGLLSEPQAMQNLALTFGVERDRLILDPAGHNTWATAQNTRRLAQEFDWQHIAAVSHAYHLPRLRQACADAGLDVECIAAVEARRLDRRSYFVLREVPAWWVYWLRGLAPRMTG